MWVPVRAPAARLEPATATVSMAFMLPALTKPSWAGAFLPPYRSPGVICDLNSPQGKMYTSDGLSWAVLKPKQGPSASWKAPDSLKVKSGFTYMDGLAENCQNQLIETIIRQLLQELRMTQQQGMQLWWSGRD